MLIDVEKPFVDKRGVIQPIVEADFKSALLITSRKGSIRANHYHLSDWHYCYVLSGKMEYHYKSLDSRSSKECVIVNAGEMVYTPPLVEHAMRFLEDTVFLTLSKNSRNAKSYESDTKRVVLLEEDSEFSIRKNLKHRSSCRICSSKELALCLSLSPSPLANSFFCKNDLEKATDYFPLDLYFCNSCGHVQLLDVVDPSVLFEHYLYASGTSTSFIDHFQTYAHNLIGKYRLSSDSLAVDIGSNDGTLLKFFQNAGMSVLGVDPAENITKLALANGIDTVTGFFTYLLSQDILKKYGKASLITANNVFAHVDDLHSFVAGIKNLLASNGVFVFEVSYLGDVCQNALFDTVYHEHLSYHSVKPLIPFFEKFGMELINVERVSTHGGSIRVHVQLFGGEHKVQPSVREFVDFEGSIGIDKIDTFKKLSQKVEFVRLNLMELLINAKNEGKTIAAFGAPAKSTTMIHHFNLSSQFIDFIVDDSSLKQGLYTPGSHIQILPVAELYKRNPDYVIVFAWNFADSIIEKHQQFKGRFIVPFPSVEIR